MIKDEEVRGEEARQILQSELYQEAYRIVQENIVTQLTSAELAKDKRETLNHLLIAHHKIKRYMEQVLYTGTMAAMEEERKRTLADRLLMRH